jgi:NADH-quinone oxidoreductase subunit K
MSEYYILSTTIFIIGLLGIVINRRNIIIMLMSIELMLIGINISLITGAETTGDILGELGGLIILIIAAGESAIGLSILVAYKRVRGTISVKYINLLRG